MNIPAAALLLAASAFAQPALAFDPDALMDTPRRAAAPAAPRAAAARPAAAGADITRIAYAWSSNPATFRAEYAGAAFAAELAYVGTIPRFGVEWSYFSSYDGGIVGIVESSFGDFPIGAKACVRGTLRSVETGLGPVGRREEPASLNGNLLVLSDLALTPAPCGK